MVTIDFSPEVVAAIRALGVDPAEALNEYVRLRESILGAPTVETATVADAPGLASPAGSVPGESWTEYLSRLVVVTKADTARNNPFMPNWQSKSDDRPNMWVGDTWQDPSASPVPAALEVAVDEVLQKACDFPAESCAQMLVRGVLVGKDKDTLEAILTAVVGQLPTFVTQAGTGDNVEFRWGKAVTTLAAFGYSGFRQVARALKDEEHWDHLASLQEDEWVDTTWKCREITGYPAGLYRADALKLYWAIKEFFPEDLPGRPIPSWWRGVTLLHLLKYVRYVDGSSPYLMVAYEGQFAQFPLEPEQLNQPLSATANRVLARDLCTILKLPFNRMDKGKTRWERITDALLGFLCPASFVRARSLADCPEYIPPPKVTVSRSLTITRRHEWLDLGVMLKNVATIDAETGVVDFDEPIMGPDVLAYNWDIGTIDPSDLMNWRSTIPNRVDPRLPSEFYKMFIKNINFLGHERPLLALLDAVILFDLHRHQMAGSEIGLLAAREFPIISIYPTGGTKLETTNQGKTNLASLVIRTMQPLAEVVPMPNESAPNQRTVAESMRKYGTVVLDEFQLPVSQSHMLSKTNLQSMTTGSGIPMGRVLENAATFKLQHPIGLCAKFSAIPPDMRNRQIAIFMDQLTPATRLPDEQLALLMTARIPYMARLSAMRWAKANGFLDAVRKLAPISTHWRFNSHLAIAKWIIEKRGGVVEEIGEYFKAAESMCEKQLDLADESGLVEELGITSAFSLKYYWDSAQPGTLDHLEMKSTADKGLFPTEALQILVEDGGKRQLHQVLREYRLKERTAAAKFSTELGLESWTRDKVTISRGSKADAKGRERACILVQRQS